MFLARSEILGFLQPYVLIKKVLAKKEYITLIYLTVKLVLNMIQIIKQLTSKGRNERTLSVLFNKSERKLSYKKFTTFEISYA